MLLHALSGVNNYVWFVVSSFGNYNSSVHTTLISAVIVACIFTSPAAAVVKCCNECICVSVCVCLSVHEHISQTTCVIFTKFILCLLPIAVARSSSGEVTQSQGEGAILGFFFPIDNALCSLALGTHTKTAEPIQMPFGLITLVSFMYHVLDGGPDPQGEGSVLGGKHSGPL